MGVSEGTKAPTSSSCLVASRAAQKERSAAWGVMAALTLRWRKACWALPPSSNLGHARCHSHVTLCFQLHNFNRHHTGDCDSAHVL